MEKADIYLNITSPEKSLTGLMVSRVGLPGLDGRFTVLPGHAPMIAALAEGDIEYVKGDRKSVVHIRSGFAEVCDNKVTVCAEI